MRAINHVTRKGTVRLLYLTKELDKEKANELLGYIGALEYSERHLIEKIENFYWGLPREISESPER